MKESELTNKIMMKVVGYEKRRVVSWILTILVGFIVFLAIAAISLWYTAVILGQTKSLELLTLFREDWEVIREFWRETIITFFQELPTDSLIILVVSIILLLVIIIYSFKRWGRLKRKLSSIDQFQKRHNDK